MGLRENLTRVLGGAWHVNPSAFLATLIPAVDGTPEAGKVVTTDANNNVTSFNAAVVASGGTTSRLYSDRFAEFINVKDYGAVGDGINDDTSSIQAAFDKVRALTSTAIVSSGLSTSLVLPPGVYKTTNSIDATNIRLKNFFVHGDGAVIYGNCAGKPIIDMIRSRYWGLQGLALWGDQINTPSIGIQIGRSSDGQSSGEFRFDELHLDGYYTSTPFYALASEINTFRHCRFWNSQASGTPYCFIMDCQNAEHITSAFQTISANDTLKSNLNNSFIQCDFRNQGTGRVFKFSGQQFQNVRFFDSYLFSPDNYLVEFYQTTNGRGLHFDTHCEGTGAIGVFIVDNVNPSVNVGFADFLFRDSAPVQSGPIFNVTGSTRTVLIDGLKVYIGEPPGATTLIFGTGGGGASKMQAHGIIEFDTADTLDLSNGYFSGDVLVKSSTAIIGTLGTQNIIRRPDTSASRLREIKGKVRFTGTTEAAGASSDNYLDVTGGASGTSPSLTAGGGTDSNVDVVLTPKGTGRVKSPGLPYVLKSDAAGLNLTGSVSETALATVTMPANSMGPNGYVLITAVWTVTNNANNKTLRVRLDGLTGTAFFADVVTTTNGVRSSTQIYNRNSASSQVGHAPGAATQFGPTGATQPVTGAVNTALNKDIVISGELANSADAIKLESYTIEVVYLP